MTLPLYSLTAWFSRWFIKNPRIALSAPFHTFSEMQYLLLPCLPSFKSDKEIYVMAKIISEWIRCPVCGNKTRLQIRADTELKNFPLHCPKCRQESLINAKDLQVTVIKGIEMKTQNWLAKRQIEILKEEWSLVSDFLGAAFPWILIGLFVAISCSLMSKKEK